MKAQTWIIAGIICLLVGLVGLLNQKITKTVPEKSKQVEVLKPETVELWIEQQNPKIVSIRDKRFIQMLGRALYDPKVKDKTARYAVEALAGIGDEEARGKMINVLKLIIKRRKGEIDWREISLSETLVRNIITELTKLKDYRAIEPLIELIGRRSVGIAAIWALGRFKDKRAVTPLIKHIQEERIYVGREDDIIEACNSLVLIGDRRAIEPLRKLRDRVERWKRFGGTAHIYKAACKALNHFYGVK
jgi:HEAT repeat protein